MQGYYYCGECKIAIEVLSRSANANYGKMKTHIPHCPICKKMINEIDQKEFKEYKSNVWLQVKKEYIYKHVGKRIIDLSIKFL